MSKNFCEACGQVIDGTMVTTAFGTHYHRSCVTDDSIYESDTITEV